MIYIIAIVNYFKNSITIHIIVNRLLLLQLQLQLLLVTVTVSLTGSLRKGYGLTDDVASYSSN
jgi:hypothetical protein